MRLLNLKEQIKKKEALGNRMLDYDACHHCKHLFKRNILIKCNYKVSTMGLPVHNYVVTDPFLFSQTESENQTSKKPQVNKKRNCYSMFQRIEGDLVCQRMYCRSCLKQNYDLILADIQNKPDWICPFCQGNCYCTRCLRNELIMKYKGIFMLLGGDINLVQRESLLEYFSLAQSLQRRREHIENELNIARGVKGQMKNMKMKEEQAIKIYEIQRLRQLCQHISKREKCKFELLKQNIDLFRDKYQFHTDKEFPQIDLNTLTISHHLIPTDKRPYKTMTHLNKNALTLDSMISKDNNKIKMIQISKIFKKKSKKHIQKDALSLNTVDILSQPGKLARQSDQSIKLIQKTKKIRKQLKKQLKQKELSSGKTTIFASQKAKRKYIRKNKLIESKKLPRSSKKYIRKTRSHTASKRI